MCAVPLCWCIVPAIVAVLLALGIVLSVASKLLQFLPLAKGAAWLGNVLVLPAATCLTLAALIAVPAFRGLIESETTRTSGIALAAGACVVVLCFQLFTMSLFGERKP
jgi:hypothetical protein